MRILLADDHCLFRSSLRSLLETRGIEVVAEASNGREAIDLTVALKPDLVLMDLAMPVLGGIEATRHLVEAMPEVKVVILTASMEDEDLFEALLAGAHGYLLKSLESNGLFDFLDRVLTGEPALTPKISRKVLEAFAQRDRPRRPTEDPNELTSREHEILKLMVEGETANRQIALRLGIGENTVKYHVRNLLDKLHLTSRAQAVSHAVRHGVVDLRKDRPPDR